MDKFDKAIEFATKVHSGGLLITSINIKSNI